MDPLIKSDWEAVIGLEIHVELNTRSKLFSSAANHFGDEPNTNITDICTGQPGTLPCLNKEAVRKAVLFGCAIKAKIAPYSRFDRKSYFYPDSPRNFQITQYEQPIITDGHIVADVGSDPKCFTIARAHLEDDAGMLKHFSHFAAIDYNRAGVPLIEIVSEPCIHTAQEAIAYATAIKAVCEYLDISDCNMEEGSLRMDVNVSVRPKGETTLRNKIEIKNMNSFNFMGIAIEKEIERQITAYVTHKNQDYLSIINQATYRFDPDKKETVLMRVKESAEDYRYFSEPDLPPLVLEQEYIEAICQLLPELPYEKEKRYREVLGLSQESALILVNDKSLALFFEEALTYCSHAKALCNWMVVEFAGRLKEKGKRLVQSGITPKNVAQLVQLIDSGRLTGKMAKEVADLMVLTPTKEPEAIIQEHPEFSPIVDSQVLETIIDQVFEEEKTSVQDYKAGKSKAFGFLVGQVMKKTQGKASPPLVNELIKKKLS